MNLGEFYTAIEQLSLEQKRRLIAKVSDLLRHEEGKG